MEKIRNCEKLNPTFKVGGGIACRDKDTKDKFENK